ncbi:hypothetical protein M0812_19350 [Anaeramoeba flamelloides]|uniref:RGS domain-containing protein n=1 Tax=Anaeramoeba flamelloides TaxID=1746091 RepID=A0AAV7Z0M5_9EUKA|nr:hypothetical protein M0812_19350 [Anaeramoeba flamelloides]
MTQRVKRARSVSNFTHQELQKFKEKAQLFEKKPSKWKRLKSLNFKKKTKKPKKNRTFFQRRSPKQKKITKGFQRDAQKSEKEKIFELFLLKKSLEDEYFELRKKLRVLKKKKTKNKGNQIQNNTKQTQGFKIKQQELKVEKFEKILQIKSQIEQYKIGKQNQIKLQRHFGELQKELKEDSQRTNDLLRKLKKTNLKLTESKKQNDTFTSLKQSTKVGRELLEAKKQLHGILENQFLKLEKRERKLQFEIDKYQFKIDPDNDLLKTYQIVSQTLIKIQTQKKEKKKLSKQIVKLRELIDLSEDDQEKVCNDENENENEDEDENKKGTNLTTGSSARSDLEINTEERKEISNEESQELLIKNENENLNELESDCESECENEKENFGEDDSNNGDDNEDEDEKKNYIKLKEMDCRINDLDSTTSDSYPDLIKKNKNNVENSHLLKKSVISGLSLQDPFRHIATNRNLSISLPNLKIPKDLQKSFLEDEQYQDQDQRKSLKNEKSLFNNDISDKKSTLTPSKIRAKIGQIESDIEIKSMDQLLAIPKCIDYFKEFLCQRLNQENIMFFQDVKNLKNSMPSTKQLAKVSKKIFKKYIEPESVFEINIISTMRKEIIKNIHEKNYSINMFDSAVNTVFDHMNLNCWQDFQDSLLYFKLIASLKKDPNFTFSPNKKKLKLVRQIKINHALNEEIKTLNNLNITYKLAERLLDIVMDLFTAHYSVSRSTINLKTISKSISFQKFVHLTGDLQLINLEKMNESERLCFFLNVYNTLFLHSLIIYGFPNLQERNSRRQFFSNNSYIIANHYFSLDDIYHGILRGNKNSKHSQNFFKSNDIKKKFTFKKIHPQIHFALYNLSFQNYIHIYQPKDFEQKLIYSTQHSLKNLIRLKNNLILLPKLFENYQKDFNGKDNILNWVSKYYTIENDEKLEKMRNYKIKFNQVNSKKYEHTFFLNLKKSLALKFIR